MRTFKRLGYAMVFMWYPTSGAGIVGWRAAWFISGMVYS